jgi:hypothetical protein
MTPCVAYINTNGTVLSVQRVDAGLQIQRPEVRGAALHNTL